MNWISLTQSSQIKDIVAQSQEKPVLIFKHSHRCYISKMALRNFEHDFTNPTDSNCYMLDVVGDRLLSIEVVDEFKVQHESPQLIVVSKGVAIYHTSHEGIEARETEKITMRL